MRSLGSVVITIGIVLFVSQKEYFMGILSTITGILIALNLATTWDNKLVNCGLGVLCLIGGILFFFSPELAYSPEFPLGNFEKAYHYMVGAMLTIGGIYIIVRGLID